MPFKFKRRFLSKIPFVFISILILFLLGFSIYKFIPKFLSTSFVSPLARNPKYKPNSIEDLLSKKNIPFEKVDIATDSSYLVLLKDNGKVAISAQKDINSQISSLQLILSRLTIEGKKFKKLDLRFDKPLIEF